MSAQVGFVPAVAAARRPTPRGPFGAILWKEFREGWAVALVGLVVVSCTRFLSLGLETALTSGNTVTSYSTTPAASFFTLTTALVGLIIGGAYMRRERSGDMRALLVHRPIDASLLFWGKLCAAAAWYLIAVIFPIAYYAIEHMRHTLAMPYLPAMMLPDVADGLTGFAYMVAGMLVMQRQAKWFGSRLAPIGAAIVATMWVVSAATFGKAMMCLGPVVALLILAARASFIAGGYYAPLSRTARIAVGAVVGAGVLLFGMIFVGAAAASLELPDPHSEVDEATELRIATNGEIVRITREFIGGSVFSKVKSVRDTSGNIIAQQGDTAPHLLNGRRIAEGVFSASAIALNSESEYETSGRHGYRGTEDLFIGLASGQRLTEKSWYYLTGPRVIEVFGVRPGRSRHIGWIGPDGFVASDSMPMHRFPTGIREYATYTHQQPLIVFPGEVYRLNFDSLNVRRVFTAPVGESVVGASASDDSAADARFPHAAQFNAIATTRHLYLQAFDGTPQLVLPRDPAAARFGTVQVTRAVEAEGSPIFAWYTPAYGAMAAAELDTARARITRFTSSGVQVAQAVLPRDTAPMRPRTQWGQIAVNGVFQGVVLHALAALLDANVASIANFSSAAVIGAWIAAILGSIGAAVLAAVITRRYAFEQRRRLGWVLFGLVGGPFAITLMLALTEWPARERCPSCQQRRVVTRETCEHCDAPFAPPPRNGTEVFDMGGVLAS